MAFDIEASKEYVLLTKEINMAHKKIDDKVVVDWKTGDPEGDRITLLAAYRDFIKEIESVLINDDIDDKEAPYLIGRIFLKWNIDTNNQIDDVPRVWIKRPEQ